jgi:multisubunit Na+/H+ antiporter MnhC subunit
MDANRDRHPHGGVASAGYRWYAGAQVVSIVGTMMGYTALYWLTLHIAHGDAVVLSEVVAAQFLPMLLFSRRAGTIAIGCVQAVDVPARQTFMLDLVGPAELRRGTSLYATVTGLAKITGPGLAGVIIAASGETAVFFADAASFLGVIVVLGCLSGDVRHGPAADRALVQARRFRWVLDLPRGIQAAVVTALLLGGFGLQFGVTNPLMATRVFHLGSVGFGLLGTFMAVGGISGNYYSSRRKDPGKSEFLVWAAVFGIAESVAAVMPVVWAYDLTMIVLGGATQLFAVSATVYVQQATSAAQRGHALSAYNAGFMGFVPAGAFLVAGVAAAAGIRWALAGPGLAIVACSAIVLVSRSLPPLRRGAPGIRPWRSAPSARSLPE